MQYKIKKKQININANNLFKGKLQLLSLSLQLANFIPFIDES